MKQGSKNVYEVATRWLRGYKDQQEGMEERLSCNEEGSGAPRRATAFRHESWILGVGGRGVEWERRVGVSAGRV